MQSLRHRVLQGIFPGTGEVPGYRLTREDWAAIHQIAVERYQAWEWNFGRTPRFSLHKARRFPWGEVVALLKIEECVIRSIKFHGAILEVYDVTSLEAALGEVRYEREHIRAAVSEMVGIEDESSPVAELARSLVDWLI